MRHTKKKIHCLSDIQISLGVLYFIEERQGDGIRAPDPASPPSHTDPLLCRLGMVCAAVTLTLLEQPAPDTEILTLQ